MLARWILHQQNGQAPAKRSLGYHRVPPRTIAYSPSVLLILPPGGLGSPIGEEKLFAQPSLFHHSSLLHVENTLFHSLATSPMTGVRLPNPVGPTCRRIRTVQVQPLNESRCIKDLPTGFYHQRPTGAGMTWSDLGGPRETVDMDIGSFDIVLEVSIVIQHVQNKSRLLS